MPKPFRSSLDDEIVVKLAVVLSHPVQYLSPIFRELARRADLTVFYGFRPTPEDQARAGFNVEFEWDVDLLSGYPYEFLTNVSANPGSGHFTGINTPDVGLRLADGGFDAVMVMGWHLKGYWQAIYAARRLGVPVLVRGDSHLDTARDGLKRLAKNVVYPPMLRAFDAALYVGQKSRAYYEHYRFPTERLFFSPHCVDIDWFAARSTPTAREELRGKLGIAPGTPVALFAGKLVPFKRPLDTIAAAAVSRAAGTPIEVLVAGSGALENDMRAQAARLHVPLHMLGFCNQSRMPSAFAASDLLVLPSEGRETWGLVANEALACGRPVIVSDACGCAPDLAADGKAGSVVPVGNIAAIATALGEVAAGACKMEDIAAKSAKYSVGAAVDGILRAATAVSRG